MTLAWSPSLFHALDTGIKHWIWPVSAHWRGNPTMSVPQGRISSFSLACVGERQEEVEGGEKYDPWRLFVWCFLPSLPLDWLSLDWVQLKCVCSDSLQWLGVFSISVVVDSGASECSHARGTWVKLEASEWHQKNHSQKNISLRHGTLPSLLPSLETWKCGSLHTYV